FELTPQIQLTAGEPRYATDGVDGTHLFAPLDAKNVSATLRATYTFLPRLSLQVYSQAFLASGHFGALTAARNAAPGQVVRVSDLVPTREAPSENPDFRQGAVNVNASLRWEYRLGSMLSLVYARSQYPKFQLGPTEIGALQLGSIGRAPAVDL